MRWAACWRSGSTRCRSAGEHGWDRARRLVLGIAAAATIAGGTAFLDSALAVGFAGVVLALIASTGRAIRECLAAPRATGFLWPHQLRALYDAHLRSSSIFGWFDRGDGPSRLWYRGNLAVVGFRLLVCTLVAAALWYGFESQILKLKRYF